MTAIVTVRDIIADYLKAHGYDGLFNADSECACLLCDLIPCMSEGIEHCEPGHFAKCAEGDECEMCEDGGLHMERGPRK